MFGNFFYHNLLRNYVIVFGNLFNDITVQRFNRSGSRIQTLNVPIAYGPKQAFIVRMAQNPNLDRDVAIQLPRMGFELTGMDYAGDRKLSSTKKTCKIVATDTEKVRHTFVPVPYDLQFTLSIFVKNADDGAQIVEQILPYFTPDWTVSMNVFPELDITLDIPYTLNSINIEDTYEQDFLSRRALVWNLDFVVKGYFYGPSRTGGIIKRTKINNFTSLEGGGGERITLTPGLTANGEPTSDPALSIDPLNISADDDYGFATSIESFIE